MTKEAMSNAICNALKSVGYESVSGGKEHKAFNKDFIDALAEGIVKHIQAEAKANVTSGSSAGSWSIQ